MVAEALQRRSQAVKFPSNQAVECPSERRVVRGLPANHPDVKDVRHAMMILPLPAILRIALPIALTSKTSAAVETGIL